MNIKKNNIKIIDKRVNNINYYDDILDKFDIDVTSFLQKKNDIKNRILQATGFISKLITIHFLSVMYFSTIWIITFIRFHFWMFCCKIFNHTPYEHC